MLSVESISQITFRFKLNDINDNVYIFFLQPSGVQIEFITVGQLTLGGWVGIVANCHLL